MIENLGKADWLTQNGHVERLGDLKRELEEAERNLRQITPASEAAPKSRKQIFVDAARYPEILAWQLKQAQRNIKKAYDGVLASAGLPADKVAQVKKLLLEQAASRQDAIAAAAQVGIDPHSPQMDQAVAQAVAEVGNEIKGVLGEDGYQRLTNAMRVNDTSQQLSQGVGVDLAEGGVPLTSVQTSALAQIVADFKTGPQMTNGDPRSVQIAAMMQEPPDPLTGLRPMDQTQLVRAAQVLAPQQLQILKQYMTDQLRMSTLYQNAANQIDTENPTDSP